MKLKLKDYRILWSIQKNEGISLEMLALKYGASTPKRIDLLVNERLIEHTHRTYSGHPAILDTIGKGNNCFKVSDAGLITLENKRDDILQKFTTFLAGYLLGILSAVIISVLTT